MHQEGLRGHQQVTPHNSQNAKDILPHGKESHRQAGLVRGSLELIWLINKYMYVCMYVMG